MKALVHLVPRDGEEAAFADRIAFVAGELRDVASAEDVALNALQRLPKDPFGRATPYLATLELTGDGVDAETLDDLLAGLGSRVERVARLEQSTALIGEDVVFVASERAPVRYQYLMRRNEHYDHAGYLKRYREIHSDFGVRTPGKLGYVQFHVDLQSSRRAAEGAGLGVWEVDSVSELHLASVEAFIGEVAHWGGGKQAIDDEKLFVDRRSSLDFCSSVDWAPGN